MESFAAKADKRPPDFEDLGKTPRGL